MSQLGEGVLVSAFRGDRLKITGCVPSSMARARFRVALAAMAIILLGAPSTWADSMGAVTSQAAQSPNDSVQWSRLGGNATVLPQSFNTTSTGGTSVAVGLRGPNSLLAVVCPASPGACSWAGPGMPASDTLIWTSNGNNGGNGPITLSFSRGESAVGALIQADGASQFTTTVQAFNGGTSLGSFTETSDSRGSAVYLGVVDQTGSNITSVTFNLVSSQGATADFAIDSLTLGSSSLTSPPPTPVATVTATAVRTPVATPTSTPTPAPIATRTATPAPIVTPTPTPAPIPTPTPTPISAGSITFVGAGPLADYSTAVTTVSVGLPSGVKAGDTLLAQIIIYDGTGSDVPTPPIGWSGLRHDVVNNGNKATSWLYYRVAGSAEPASYAWNIGSNWAAGVIGAWRGASVTPVDNSSGSTAAGASPLSDSAPSLAPNNNNELQVYFYGSQSGAAPTITPANALNHRFDVGSSKEGFALAFDDLFAPPAGNGSPTYSATSSIAGTAAMTAQAVLLVPGGQSPVPTPTHTVSGPTPTVVPTAVATATAIPPPPSGISFVGTSQLTDSSLAVSTVSVSVPSGVRAGDTLLAQIVVFDGSASDVPSGPSGWTSIRREAVNNGNKITSWIYYKVAGSSEPASYGWNIGSNWAAGVMGAWRGASSSPIDKSSGATGAGSNLISATAPSQSPAVSNELQVYFYGSQSGNAPNITLSNGPNQRFNSRSAKEGFTLAIGDIAAPAAGVASATYPASATISGSSLVMTAQAILLH